jgi:hypothetical protein
MKTVDVNAESNGYTSDRYAEAEARARATANRIKSRPDILAGRIILAGAGAVVGLVIIANIAPYSRLANAAIYKAFGISLPWLGRLMGVCGLSAVGTGEVFPYTMTRPSRMAYVNAGAIATLAYGIDAAIAIWAWPPLRVGVGEFVNMPLMSNINWANCLIILVVLFGVELFIKLCRLVNQSNRSQD